MSTPAMRILQLEWRKMNEENIIAYAVYSRAYKVNDAGDMDGWRMRFSVKYGDVIVSVSTKGVDPEWLYHQLVSLLPE